MDAAGDIFIADNGNQRVVKVPAVGTPTTVGVGLMFPQGLAVDGAGDLFIADNNLNEVVEVPAGCTISSCQITLGSGLTSQLGVAVDGLGDVFIGDFNGSEVVEVPANGGPQTMIYSGAWVRNPVGLAVDAAGDLFVADYGLNASSEDPARLRQQQLPDHGGYRLDYPEAVVVDAAGDVFVAEEVAPYVVEVPAGCTTLPARSRLTSPKRTGWRWMPMGNIFIPKLNGNQVIKVNHSQPPSLSFRRRPMWVAPAATARSMSVTLQNVGNATLNFPILRATIPASGRTSAFSNGLGDCPLDNFGSSRTGHAGASGIVRLFRRLLSDDGGESAQ